MNTVNSALKSFALSLSLLGIALLMAPASIAQQYGMDQQYNQSISDQTQETYPYSMADTGTQSYTSQESAWQDMAYIQGQQQAPFIPGTMRAPVQQTQFGAASTFVGNTAQFLKGRSSALNSSLPKCETGLNAINGRYTGPACGFDGPGGFNNRGGRSSVYAALPTTSTSIQQTLNVVDPSNYNLGFGN